MSRVERTCEDCYEINIYRVEDAPRLISLCPLHANVNTWQPIETAPKGREAVLGFWAGNPVNGKNYAIMRKGSGCWVNYDYPDEEYRVDPSHWMPLPAPPKEQE